MQIGKPLGGTQDVGGQNHGGGSVLGDSAQLQTILELASKTCWGGLEVEDEEKQGFKDTSRFFDGLQGCPQPLRLIGFWSTVFSCLEMP